MADAPQPRLAPLRSSRQWQALTAYRDTRRGSTLHELFDADPQRAERFSVDAVGLHMDYSKQLVDTDAITLLTDLANARGLGGRIEAMFRGDHVNTTEDRPALHIALRAPRDTQIFVDGADVVVEVHAVLDRMARFCTEVRDGSWTGHSGKRIRNVINIGIGGSDLGPVMAYEALKHYSNRDMTFRFVSNVDATDLTESIRDLDPAETLFIVCSKSFATTETLTNARSARDWISAGLDSKDAVARHFVAVSSDADRVAEFGIDTERMFGLWDWVGGRYSMDSAIGLSTMLAIGADEFTDMLAGFHAMDEHFRSAPLEQNLPVLMGLLAVWNTNFLRAATHAVLPYEQYLKRFPAYLQQLAMESNGKHVTLDGKHVDYLTAPIYWGEAGTNGQHSFYQLLHQGTRIVPCDFIGFCEPLNPLGEHHDLLIANMIAQSEALAFGNSPEQVRAGNGKDALVPHRVCEGNRPSTTVLAQRLTPHVLGALVALYEHSVFTQGTIWNIDSFDQWGVELGKQLASRTLADIQRDNDAVLDHDSSTNDLIERYRKHRSRS